jgi:hypothetical protein
MLQKPATETSKKFNKILDTLLQVNENYFSSSFELHVARK